jgi:hypothetical protein
MIETRPPYRALHIVLRLVFGLRQIAASVVPGALSGSQPIPKRDRSMAAAGHNTG